MAFESIRQYIDKIESLLSAGQSPRAIALGLNIPQKYQTINRYKKEVFDIQGAAREAWVCEQAKPPESRFEEGKARIVDSLELLNLAKLRSWQLLSLDIGDPYTLADGTKQHLSLASAAIHWEVGARIGTQAIKQEQEIAGDDPESREANALETLSDEHLRAIIAATEEID